MEVGVIVKLFKNIIDIFVASFDEGVFFMKEE